MTIRPVGDWIPHLLKAHGVDTVFGMPGAHSLPMYRELGAAGIRHVGVRHEQGAGFMADGYARASRRPGVALLISGPGVTNAATPLGQAYSDSVPLLLLTAAITRGDMGLGIGALHEITDQRAVTEPLTGVSVMALTPEQVPHHLAAGFARFAAARPRPVHLSVPLDVLEASLEWATPEPVAPSRSGPDPAGIVALARLLEQAERPVVLAGGGAIDAAEPLRAIVETTGALFVSTVAGKGILAESHAQSAGSTLQRLATRRAISDADLVIAIGTEIAEPDLYVSADMEASGAVDPALIEPRLALGGRFARIDIEAQMGNPIEPGDGAFDSLSFVVECWWDRFRPPLQLQYPSTWKEMLWSRGHTYATKANPENHKRILEFWNEPYLNWSYKPGVAYDPLWYDQSNMEENGPVRRNGSTEFEPHLIWQYGNWYDPLDKSWAADPLNIYNRISHGWNQKMHEEGCPYPCLEIFSPGDTIYPESTNRIVVFERLIPVDTSQHSYYSARQNEKYYREMYTTLADTVRKLNPDVQLIAGWGFEIHKDNWTPWRQLLKPLLDDHIDLIDGIHQHHYGMDTRIITAEYETIAAYVKIKYNRELKFLNTETGGFIDPQRPESVSNNPGHITQAKKALNAFTYNTKDIVYMLAHSPDKAFSRAIHESQKTNGGVAAAFKILKSLRGDMLFSTSNHKNIWQVASIEDDLITIACFNGDTIDHNVVFSVYAPEGLSLTQVTNIYADTNLLDTIELYSQTDLINNISWSGSRLIKAYSPIVLQFKLSDNVQSITDTVKARQFMADTILAKIPVMGDLTTNIAISDNEVLNNAESARLKFVLMRYESGGKVLINGHEYSLENYAGGNPDLHQGGISYIHINKDHLTDDNVVTFHAGNSDVDLWMVSLELYTEQLSQYLNGIASEEKEKNIFHVYPNPAKELITIEGNIPEHTTITLYTLTGKTISRHKTKHKSTRESIPVNSLSPGLYLLKMNSHEKSYKIFIK